MFEDNKRKYVQVISKFSTTYLRKTNRKNEMGNERNREREERFTSFSQTFKTENFNFLRLETLRLLLLPMPLTKIQQRELSSYYSKESKYKEKTRK